MNRPTPHWHIYRIEVPCPNCGQKDLQRIGELIGEESVACRICGEPIDVSKDEWRAALKDIADGLSKIYVISGKRD